eukprot:scaffold492_cov257-Pinguiococcus_pyrenoidosus.AAC.39
MYRPRHAQRRQKPCSAALEFIVPVTTRVFLSRLLQENITDLKSREDRLAAFVALSSAVTSALETVRKDSEAEDAAQKAPQQEEADSSVDEATDQLEMLKKMAEEQTDRITELVREDSTVRLSDPIFAFKEKQGESGHHRHDPCRAREPSATHARRASYSRWIASSRRLRAARHIRRPKTISARGGRSVCTRLVDRCCKLSRARFPTLRLSRLLLSS